MTDVELGERAFAFVDANGDDLDRCRAAIATGVEKPERLDPWIAAAQQDDGGFCFRQLVGGDPVAGTLHAISALTSAGRSRSAPAEAGVSWLETAREPDGSWVLAGRGPHANHLATGFLAGFLAQSPFARAQTLEEAGDWLAAHWSPELVRNGDFAMIAAHAHFFANYPHEATDAVLQWCGRELERGVRGGLLPALFALRVFALCDAPVFPGTRLEAGTLLERLVNDQAPDGGWLPGLPEAWRVAATLAALEAWRRFGPGAFAGGG